MSGFYEKYESLPKKGDTLLVREANKEALDFSGTGPIPGNNTPPCQIPPPGYHSAISALLLAFYYSTIFDCFLSLNIEYGLRNNEIGESLTKYIKELSKNL